MKQATYRPHAIGLPRSTKGVACLKESQAEDIRSMGRHATVKWQEKEDLTAMRSRSYSFRRKSAQTEELRLEQIPSNSSTVRPDSAQLTRLFDDSATTPGAKRSAPNQRNANQSKGTPMKPPELVAQREHSREKGLREDYEGGGPSADKR